MQERDLNVAIIRLDVLQDSREKQGRLNQAMVFGHGVKPSVHVIRSARDKHDSHDHKERKR